MLALASSGVIWLVFDVVTARWVAVVAGAVAVVVFAAIWFLLPLTARDRGAVE